MLSPDALDRAGETVAALFAEVEADMLDVLARSLAERDVTSMTMTAAALLAQSHRAELEELARMRWPEMDAEARSEIESLLRESDDDDAARLGSSERLYPAHAKAAADSLASILERDNLAMADAAVAAFLEKSARAILQTETGALDSERAVRLAVRDLERDGLALVTYRDAATGRETVRNRVDVAVRRHVRTQANQAGARMTLDRLGSMGNALVEVTSHAGARPEHAEWQGRCYSLRGEERIGGVLYRDFYSATGYGRVDGLCGANCRHSFGPYLHGAPRAYEEDPEHESGLPSAEVYRLEQGQRYRERRIREAKRELRGAAIAHGAQRTPASLADLNAARALVAERQAAMREYIREANARAAPGTLALRRQYHREWVGGTDAERVAVLSREKPIRGRGNGTPMAVDRRAVNGRAYGRKFESLGLPKRAARQSRIEALRILADRDGTMGERMSAVSWRTGRLVTDTFSHPVRDSACGFTAEQAARIARVEGGVVLIHNHPMSLRPSFTDIRTCAENDFVRSSIVACHDGTIYEIRCDDASVVEAYENARARALLRMPGTSDGNVVDELATDAIYMENEAKKWFEMKKIR